jgi:Ankyrin repeats (3 copies)/Ankyrin repeat
MSAIAIMPLTKTPRTRVTMLLCALMLHSCQQPKLNVVGDDPTKESPQTSQVLSAQSQHATSATSKHEPRCIVLTSSSDSSPDAKRTDLEVLDRDAATQPIVNVLQGSAVTSAHADALAMTEANREGTRKRLVNMQISRQDEKILAAKHAKKEAKSLTHEAWFKAFADTIEKIEHDSEDDEAWEQMKQLIEEDTGNKFLTASITCPNDSNPATAYEYTPLHYAAARGILALVEVLVKQQNIPVDLQTQGNENTPLHLAASRGHLNVVQFLVDQGADPKLTDRDEGSALHYAAAGKQGEMSRDVIEYLVKRGADLKSSAKNGSSLLSAAVFAGNIAVVDYWVDTCTRLKDPAPEINTITERALKIAKHRRVKFPQECEIQSYVVQELEELLASRKIRNMKTSTTAQHNASKPFDKIA